MNGPRRWLESEEASTEALDLLRAGRPPRSLDEATRRRSRQRVARLAVLPAAALGTLASWPQLALGALVGAAGTVAVMSAWSAISSPPPQLPSSSRAASSASAARSLPARVASPARTSADVQPVSPSPAVSSPAIEAHRPVGGAKPAPSEAPELSAPADGLQQEIRLLEEARRKLGSDPAGARRVLLEHEQRFAGGQLRIEREFLLIDALVRLGRRSEADARARALEAQAPASLYGERLDQILGRSGSGKNRE